MSSWLIDTDDLRAIFDLTHRGWKTTWPYDLLERGHPSEVLVEVRIGRRVVPNAVFAAIDKVAFNLPDGKIAGHEQDCRNPHEAWVVGAEVRA